MQSTSDLTRALERPSYSNELYDHLAAFGLRPSHEILELGCGDGRATYPLICNGFRVRGIDTDDEALERARRAIPEGRWEHARAEQLPLPDACVDAVLSAQAFHRFDRAAAMREVLRVLRPGGMVAIWWKYPMYDDLSRTEAEAALRELGVEPPSYWLTSGFKEFYAAQFSDHVLRVLPWRVAATVDEILEREASRREIRDLFRGNPRPYLDALRARLESKRSGSTWITVAYLQYLYLGRKP